MNHSCAFSAELDAAIAFLTDFKDSKRGRLGEEAYLVIAMEVVALRVFRAASLNDAAQTSASLDKCKLELSVGLDVFNALPDGADPGVPG